MQLAADAVLNSRADDEDQDLEDDSETTIKAMEDLYEAQRMYSYAVKGREPPTKGKAVSKSAKGKAVIATPVPSVPVIARPPFSSPALELGGLKAALLKHAKAMIGLETVRTKRLKTAAEAFHVSFSKALDEYQTGLDEYLACTKSAVGGCPSFFPGAC